MNIHEQNIAFVKTKLIDELFSMVKIKGDFIKKNEKYIPTKEMDKLTELVILSSETLEHLVNRMILNKILVLMNTSLKHYAALHAEKLPHVVLGGFE